MTTKPEKNLELFFPQRNGKVVNPRKNVNYTSTTITYMTPAETADTITSTVVSNMVDKGIKPIHIVESCGGIGGNTMSFLDNPDVDKVFVFEIQRNRAKILEENLKMYGFDKSRYQIITSGFNGIPEGAINPVIYFDPPWLAPGKKGEKSRSTDYLTENILLGDKTVREWIESMPNISMSISRFPPGYNFSTPIGWSCASSDLGTDGLVVICIPPEEQRLVEVSKEIDRATWLRNVQVYIFKTINLLTGLDTNALNQKLVQKGPVNIFAAAFTHPSYDPNPHRNYKKLALIGNALATSAFYEFMDMEYIGLDHATLDKMHSRFMSRDYKIDYLEAIGGLPLIRTRVSDSFGPDIFDALLGAIHKASNIYVGRGTGQSTVLNFIISLLKGAINREGELQPKDAVNPKDWVNNLFSNFGWGTPGIDSTDLGYTKRTSVLATKAFSDELKTYEVGVSSVIGTGTSADLQESIDNAYSDAMDKLINMGLDNDWIQESRKSIIGEQGAMYYVNAETRSKRDGMDRIYMSNVTRVVTGSYVQLIGVKGDGLRVILSTAFSEDPTEASDVLMTQALIDYANEDTEI